MGPRIRGEKLANEALTVVMREGHHPAQAAMDVSDYFQCKHVLVSNQQDLQDPLQAAWTHLGLGERQVMLRCQHYFAACQVVAQTDALLTMPRTIRGQLPSVLPVGVSTCRCRWRLCRSGCTGMPTAMATRRTSGCAAWWARAHARLCMK